MDSLERHTSQKDSSRESPASDLPHLATDEISLAVLEALFRFAQPVEASVWKRNVKTISNLKKTSSPLLSNLPYRQNQLCCCDTLESVGVIEPLAM
jgi:hypothetical protein